ncbi:acyl-CoA reductase [Mucilaginibacter myungsuensis]|uniref:Acyl-CoA reductase n=1 Tax=Mucilaginibacter myungsuensis TaxID=649104 RepID=A0A929L280_9SPHI|nr:acyl-CoA reductase [Mucilaginibacter myungsuensis]MBE9662745.1 acyl-CoA reductase [Mucilaginibacter myungsuensis]MDN3598165.1 acyl-CoA reductase [Mucilaginibacter myungsuensis]
MSKLQKDHIASALAKLGQQLSEPQGDVQHIIQTEQHYNAWFTPDSVTSAITAWGEALNETDIDTWLSKYLQLSGREPKKVGLILAGNIPLVGLHDVLSVLASGHHALIKASTQDARLIKQVLKLLVDIEPAFADQFSFIERLTDFDAVIATGSNNSSRYFDYYFGKVPNIIRKNRNSVAVLTGNESSEELSRLGHDIFDFYGLGCRNVSKLLVPEGYNFNHFFESIEDQKAIIHHHKYNNNYDYNKSIYLVNGDKHLDNGFLLVKEDERMASPLAVVYFEYYKDEQAITELLLRDSDNIQCIVTNVPLQVPNQVVTFGQSQHPALWDYADGIDTMDFLADL